MYIIYLLSLRNVDILPQFCKNIILFTANTVSKNKIATIKMRNNFCYPLKMAILDFSLLLYFCMSFVDGFMASFLYCFPYSYRSSNYCDSNSCRFFTLLKALAKSNGNLFAIAFKSKIVGRAKTLEREPSKKKQKTDTKKYAKRIKIDNFTRSNREKSNIAIAILEK